MLAMLRVVLTFIGVALILVPFWTVVAALTGLVVGWFFGDVITATLGNLGVYGVKPWELGLLLGFVSGLLKIPSLFPPTSPP